MILEFYSVGVLLVLLLCFYRHGRGSGNDVIAYFLMSIGSWLMVLIIIFEWRQISFIKKELKKRDMLADKFLQEKSK